MNAANLTVGTIETAELQRVLAAAGSHPLILDVRTPAEYEAVHIPGSYNVPLDLLDEHRADLEQHLSDQVILVCRSGGRATQAHGKLAPTAGGPLRVLQGGMLAWEAAGGAVNRSPSKRWDLERQVRLTVGLLLLGSMGASLAFPPVQWVAAALGAGLTFAAVSNNCMLGVLLARLPYNRDAVSCDVPGALARMSARGAQS